MAFSAFVSVTTPTIAAAADYKMSMSTSEQTSGSDFQIGTSLSLQQQRWCEVLPFATRMARMTNGSTKALQAPVHVKEEWDMQVFQSFSHSPAATNTQGAQALPESGLAWSLQGKSALPVTTLGFLDVGDSPETLLATPKGNHKIHNCCYQQDLSRQTTLSAAGAQSQGFHEQCRSCEPQATTYYVAAGSEVWEGGYASHAEAYLHQ
jgi:hypothetical protein